MNGKKLLLILGFVLVSVISVFAQTDAQGPRVPKYKSATVHDYLDVMFLTCQVYVSDRLLTDCEVAILDANGKCRGDGMTNVDPNNPTVVYVTIHGTSGEPDAQGMKARVVYGDETDRYKYDVEVEGITFDMLNNREYGDTRHPVRLNIVGEPAFEWAVEGGQLQRATPAQLTPSLLKGAVRLNLMGKWTAEQLVQLRGVMPQRTLQQVNISSDLKSCDFTGLFVGCTALTSTRFGAVPDGIVYEMFLGVNPNNIIYLPAGTKEFPEEWRNVVEINGDGYNALTDIQLWGSTRNQIWPFALDKDITLGNFKAIYSPKDLKMANGKGGWNTIVLPFKAQVYADGVQLNGNYSSTRYPETYWLMQYRSYDAISGLTFSYKEKGLEAHVPYLLAIPGNAFGEGYSQEDKTITMESLPGTVMKATPAKIVAEPSRPSDMEFLGTYTTLLSQPMYLLTTLQSGSNAFVHTDEGNLLPFHAYINPCEGVQAVQKMLMISDDYISTGIDDITVDGTEKEEIYDLSGRRVANWEEALPGIYVKNGKKILKK